MKRNFTFLLISILLLSANSILYSAPKAVKIGVTYPSQSAYVMGTGEQISGQQFQTDGIVSYKGYQYTVYYNLTRNVCVARRKMPVGAWEEVVLAYKNTADDAHNTISMGISAKDGRIHLSYDHHNDQLHYCYSTVGSANNPEEMPWLASSFSATTDLMDKAVPNATYPRFISKPDGNLLFECRFRWSGYGDSYLREYDADTQKWKLIGRYVQGEDVSPDACAYINGMTYDKFGKLHVTWCWRDDFGGGSNHDFYYAYSEDHGATWKDTFNDKKATTDLIDPVFDNKTGNSLGQTKKTFMVEAIPYNRGYINQETQDVDSRGRIHAVNSHIPDGQPDDANWASSRTKARLYHRFRKEDGTWVKKLITVNGVSVNSTRRVNLAIDSYDNAYVMATGYGVLMASSDDDYANWTLLSEDGKTGYYSEPLSDRSLLVNNGVLSFVHLSADRKIAVFDYLTKNPNTPNGNGLKTEYYSEENFTGLIKTEVVATPDQSQAPVGTKSIRWSGAFETVEGEEYTLFVNTTSRTNVYVNDRLQKITSKTEVAQDYDFKYSLIASHKNNIVIETVSASPLTLSWSSVSTAKQIIPMTSLYAAKANNVSGMVTPPVLQGKKVLGTLLMSEKKKIDASNKAMTVVSPFDPTKDYSLEVKTKVNAVEGRGLDIEARGSTGKGFRVSLGKTTANWTSILNTPNEISPVDNTVEQVYRFAVSEDKVHIYCGKKFIGTRNTEFIKDIKADDTELETAGAYGVNILTNWAGPSGSGSAVPTVYGWSASATVPWNVSGGGGGVRYESATHSQESGGSFTGRLMTIRWDAAAYSAATYFYPVTLEANKTYDFSFLYEYWANATSAQTITMGISKSAAAAGIYESKQFVTSATAQTLRSGSFRFSSQEAGQYYITFAGTYAMFGIGNLELKSLSYENSLQFGKQYNGGNLNAEVFYVSYQEGAYAPADEDVVVVPDLPKKAILPTELQSAISINALSGQKDLRTLPFNPSGDYSVELAASVTSVVGRGMDVEVRDGLGKGFRTSLSNEYLRWAAPFTNIRQIAQVESEKQVVRYAVQANKVHIYRNGSFIETVDVADIGNLNETGSVEIPLTVAKPGNLYDGLNLISNPDFKNDTHNLAPTGWVSDKALGLSPNPRIQEKSQTTELSSYPNGSKAFMFRFDGNGGSYYSYPVTLKTNKWHEYSFDLITWGENQSKEFELVISTVADGSTGIIATQKVLTPAIRATAERQLIRFYTSTDAAVEEMSYYLVFKKTTTFGTTAVTDLYLKQNGINQLLFGKNYTEGTANIDIDYINVDYSGAFAPLNQSSDLKDSQSETVIVFSVENRLFIQDIPRNAFVSVYDVWGRNVLQQKSVSQNIDIMLNSGIYIVRVNNLSKKVLIR